MGDAMLRIRFGSADIGRTRLATRPDPLWELALSLPALQASTPAAAHRSWWTTARRRLRDSPHEARAARLLADLVPLRGDFPDFITPPEAAHGLDAGLEAVASVPRARLRADITGLRPRPGGSAILRALADGDRAAHSSVTVALRRYFAAFIRPEWQTIGAHIAAERDRCAHQALSGGTERLLTGLPPGIRWAPPYLEADYPVERTVDLEDRGITLIPSYFCTVTPVTLIDPALTPVLVFPAAGIPAPPDTVDVPARNRSALAAIVGNTRADILCALAVPRTTTQLAEHIGMSVASASHHTRLLRDAGLITTTRIGQAVAHALTGPGRGLLRAPDRAAGPPRR